MAAVLTLIGFDANSQEDPLYGLSPNPWEGQTSTVTATGKEAIQSERVSTPWNEQTYYPTPPTDKYIGEKTTWNTAMGQTEMAPEVNIHNMLVMTDHLRSLGYQIPQGFDEGLKAAPSHLHDKIMSSLQYMSNDHGDPFSKSASGFINLFHSQTGFDMENLIGTSIGIIDR